MDNQEVNIGMEAIKTFLIVTYVTLFTVVLTFVIELLPAFLFGIKPSLVTQVVSTAIATFIAIFPVVKIRSRGFSLLEKVLTIIPIVLLLIFIRFVFSVGGGLDIPDLRFLMILLLTVGIAEFIPVWLVLSASSTRLFGIKTPSPNKSLQPTANASAE